MMLAPLPNTAQEWAMSYTAAPLNWRLCKLRPNSKAPILAEWNSPARTIGHDSAEAAFLDNHLGMGLVHAASGTGAFDVDSVEWACVAFAEFGIDLNEILEGYPRIASRDGRDKIIFTLPGSFPTVKLVWPAPTEDGKPISVFELRANGGQDVLPPSIHPNTGLPYRWVVSPFDFPDGVPTAPQVLLSLWKDWPSFKKQFEEACPWATKPAEPKPVIRHVSHEHGDVIGAYNRNNDIAALLIQHGYQPRGKRWLSPTSSSGIAGVVVLKDSGKCYSHHASDMLNDGHSHDAFDVFCILDHNNNFSEAIKAAARGLGIERQQAPMVDTTALMRNAEKRRAAKTAIQKKPVARPATPDHLLHPPGQLGAFVAHVLATANLPQPELAVAAALTLFGCAMGRKVASSSGLRTNLYLLGVAKTGYGKEHARRMVKEAMTAAKMTALLGGEDIASGQGLAARVAMTPNVLFQIDEFGLFLQAVQNPVAGSHKAEITTNFIKLFSAASSVYRGTEYANQKDRPRVDIVCPCVNLYGTTTPETLFPALGSSHVSSGYLNRMLVSFAADDIPKRVRVKWAPPPISVVDWLTAAQSLQDGLHGLNPDTPIVIDDSDDAVRLFDAFQAEIDARITKAEITGTAQLHARALEHAAKLAVVCELACNLNSRSVGREAAAWAIDYTRHALEVMDAEVVARVADSDFMRVTLDVIKRIKEAGDLGVTEFELGRRCARFRALKPNERDQVFAVLLRDEEAAWTQQTGFSGAGKKRMALVACEFMQQSNQQSDSLK